MADQRSITARAPAKLILLGEHAVNRGQAALAFSIGLYATCKLTFAETNTAPTGTDICTLQAQDQSLEITRSALQSFARSVDAYLEQSNYAAIERLATEDFFAAHIYVLAAFVDTLPPNLLIELSSEIPRGAGLGSGGAIFVALATALASIQQNELDDVQLRRIATYALRGDIIAHGGTASGLDTQTSLYGGVLRYTAARQGEPIVHAEGLQLVIADTGVFAPTSQVNARVRAWLAEEPVRLQYFQQIGLLSRHAELALREGNWPELGRLININQLILERIGVSCFELETLNVAALSAGALGAKLSGSGGGGIMFALVTPETVDSVATALRSAGATVIIAPIGVPGVSVFA